MSEEKGIMFALATAIVSGFSIFANKFAVGGFDPFLFTTLKNVAVGVFLLSIILIFKQYCELKALTRKQLGLLMLIGLVGGSIPFLLFFWGLSITSAVNASFIHKLMFAFVSMLSVVFLKERLNRYAVAAGIAVIIGNGLLIAPDLLRLGVGDILVFIAMLFWSCEILLSKRALEKLSPRIVAFGRMFFGSAFMLLFLGATGRLDLAASLTAPQIGWVLVTSLFLLGYVSFWYVGLKYTSASMATFVLLLGSLVTAALSYMFGGEALTIAQATGMLFLVLGVGIAMGFSGILRFVDYCKRQVVLWTD